MEYLLYKKRNAADQASNEEAAKVLASIPDVKVLNEPGKALRGYFLLAVAGDDALRALTATVPKGWALEESKPVPPPIFFGPGPF